MAQSQTLVQGLGGEEGALRTQVPSPRAWEAEMGEQIDPCVGSLCTEPQGASFLKLKKCFPQTLEPFQALVVCPSAPCLLLLSFTFYLRAGQPEDSLVRTM